MDIAYSTGLKFSLLCKSFQVEGGVRQGGWRIWAFRVAQMILNIGSLIAIALACIAIKKQKVLPYWKFALCLTILALQVILSTSGIILYVFAKILKSYEAWVIVTGMYNIFMSHFLIFAWVIGSHDVFASKRYQLPQDKLFYPTLAGVVLCFSSSIVHFLSAFFPTPFPSLLRLQLEEDLENNKNTSAEGTSTSESKVVTKVWPEDKTIGETAVAEGASTASTATGEPSNVASTT